MTNTNPAPATITLENAKGVYKVNTLTLARAIDETSLWDDDSIRNHAAAACGYGDPGVEVFASQTRLEVLIAWVESGNHLF